MALGIPKAGAFYGSHFVKEEPEKYDMIPWHVYFISPEGNTETGYMAIRITKPTNVTGPGMDNGHAAGLGDGAEDTVYYFGTRNNGVGVGGDDDGGGHTWDAASGSGMWCYVGRFLGSTKWMPHRVDIPYVNGEYLHDYFDRELVYDAIVDDRPLGARAKFTPKGPIMAAYRGAAWDPVLFQYAPEMSPDKFYYIGMEGRAVPDMAEDLRKYPNPPAVAVPKADMIKGGVLSGGEWRIDCTLKNVIFEAGGQSFTYASVRLNYTEPLTYGDIIPLHELMKYTDVWGGKAFDRVTIDTLYEAPIVLEYK